MTERSWLDRHPVLIFVTSVALVPVLTGLAGIYGSRIGADGALKAAIAQQQAGLDMTRAEEARKKRGEVYAALIDSSNSFSTLIGDFGKKMQQFEEENRTSAGIYTLSDAEANAENLARADFISKINQVFVYGSDAGFSAAEKLREVFRAGQALTPVRWRLHAADIGFDYRAYEEAIGELQRLMCREVSAEPRSGCR